MRVAASILALVLVAACSRDGTSKREYEDRVAPILAVADDRLLKLSLAVERAPAPMLAESRIRALRDVLRTSADELEDVEPPDDIRAAHASLVSGLRGLDEELAEAEQATREPGYSGWPTFHEDLMATPAARRYAGARRTIADRGYDVSS